MDAVSEWLKAQRRVIGLVENLSAEEAEVPVPACPDWSVRQLFSHMVGLDADVLDGDEPDDHNSEWTQRQVQARADRSVSELVEEWDALRDPLTRWMRENTTRPLGDVVIHEQDLRGALGRPGAQDTDGLASLRDRFVGSFADTVAGQPTIALVGPSWTWVSAGAAGDAAVVVEATDFDLARALMSRRSGAQLRAWTLRGDITPYLRGFTTLGDLPTVDLTEST